MIRKTNIIAIILSVLCLSLCLDCGTSFAATKSWPSSKVSTVAKSSIVIDADTGTVLYASKEHTKRYPASITKIMTALLTIEKGNLNDTLTYSKHSLACIKDGAANIGAVVGEKMTVKDALYGLMLQSGNECASALAEYVAGSEAKFAEMMTQRAKEAGAKNTQFKNANGLHNEKHYVTAYDMAMIMRQALKYPTFRDIINTTAYTIPKNNKRKKRFFAYQRHKMVYPGTANYYEGIIGGKTGYTDQARNTLVTAAKRNGLTIISVVLKSDTFNVYKDTRALLNYGFKHYKAVNVAQNNPAFNKKKSIFVSPFYDEDDEDGSLYIDPAAHVVIPKKASFNDLTMKASFSNNADSFATLTYSYGSHNVGSAQVLYKPKEEPTTQAKAAAAVNTQPTTAVAQTKPAQTQAVDQKQSSSHSKPSIWLKIVKSFAFKIVLATLVVLIIIGILLVKRKRKIDRIREEKRNRYRH